MTNQPKGKQDTGDEQPAAEQHIALAIESFEKEYRSRQEQSAEHDRQTLKWANRTAIGVAIYTVLTAAITVASIYSAHISYRTMVNGQRAFVFPQQTQITGMQDGPNVRWYISPVGKMWGTRQPGGS